MNDLKIFSNPSFGEVRTFTDSNNEPWFVGKDVAIILGYAKPQNAIAAHVDEDDALKQGIIDNLGREQETTLINESGLYSLILSSKLPNAKQFKKWVTSEVLPSIRKHGAYATDATIDNILNNPDFGIQLLQTLKEERENNTRLLEANRQKDDQIQFLSDTVSQMKDKVSYLDTIFSCPSTVKVKVIAQDYGMTAIAFNQLLHAYGIQYRDGDNWILYSRYIGKGYVKDVPFEYIKKNGQKAVKSTTQWTQRGRAFLYEYLKSNQIFPLIEQNCA